MNKCRYTCIYQRKLQLDKFHGYLNILVFVVPPFIVANVLRDFPNKQITTQQHSTQHVLSCMSVAICFTSCFLWFTSFFICDTHGHPYQSTAVRVWYKTDLTEKQGLQFIMNQDPKWHYSKFSVQQNRGNPSFLTDFLHSGRVAKC